MGSGAINPGLIDNNAARQGGNLMANTVIVLLGLMMVNLCNAQTRLPDITEDGITIREAWIPMPDGVRLATAI